MKLCSGCHSEIPESSTSCDHCGREVSDSESVVLLVDEDGEPVDDEFDEEMLLPDAAPDPMSGVDVPAVVNVTSPSARSTGWSRRELSAIGLAVAGGALVTFALLLTRGVASPQAATAAVERAVAPAPEPARATFPSSAKWSTSNVARWIGNSRRRFAIELVADNNVAIWQREVRPVLVVRCLSQRPEVFVFTDSAAKIEPKTEDHTVRIAFDDGAELTERWPDSADHDALFAPDGSAFTRQLTHARTMRFGFTPHNASPVVAQFNVAGLSERLHPVARECGWKP